jgi:small GTP-binding protein
MGSVFSAISRLFAADSKMEVALVGLENSGKTSLAEFLCTGKKATPFPTIGLNVKVVTKKRVTIKIWDMSGQEHARRQWARYSADCNCIIFCVDSSEMGRVATAREELFRFVASSPPLAVTPLLICLTKCDLSPRLSVEDAVLLLALELLPATLPWVVISCSSVSGAKIDEIVDWLLKNKQQVCIL